jgi:predicted enzyme related to lactoylglutathione lyase
VGGSSVVDMTHSHHSIDYVEIYVDDVAAAKAFYGGAFGWRFNDYGPDYSGIQAPDGDGEVGGISVGGTSGSSPLVLVISDNLDDSLQAVQDAGGELAEGPFDYPGGRRFHFRDPSGNVLGVFQPSDR